MYHHHLLDKSSNGWNPNILLNRSTGKNLETYDNPLWGSEGEIQEDMKKIQEDMIKIQEDRIRFRRI